MQGLFLFSNFHVEALGCFCVHEEEFCFGDAEAALSLKNMERK